MSYDKLPEAVLVVVMVAMIFVMALTALDAVFVICGKDERPIATQKRERYARLCERLHSSFEEHVTRINALFDDNEIRLARLAAVEDKIVLLANLV